MTRPKLLFYYRNGCHLCEELAAILFRDWPEQAAEMEWCDVDTDPEWLRRFGHRVPVLEQDGQTICDLLPDPARLAEYFGNPSLPV